MKCVEDVKLSRGGVVRFIFPVAEQKRALGRACVAFTYDNQAPKGFDSLLSSRFVTKGACHTFRLLREKRSAQGHFWWRPLPCSDLSEQEPGKSWSGSSGDFAILLAMLHTDRPFTMARKRVWASGGLPKDGVSLELKDINYPQSQYKLLHFLDVLESEGNLSESVFFLPDSQMNEQDPSLREDQRAVWMEWPPDQDEVGRLLFPVDDLDANGNEEALVVWIGSTQLGSFVRWLEEGSDTYEAFLQNKTVPPPPPKPFWARTWLKWMAVGALLVLLLASGLSLDVGMCGGVMQSAFSIAKGGKHGAQSMAVYRCGLLCTNRCDLLGALATKGQDALCRTACYTSELKLRCLRVQKEQARLSAEEWLLQHRKVCHLLSFQSLYSPNRQMNPLIQWHNTHCALFASKYTQQEQAKKSLITFCRNKP